MEWIVGIWYLLRAAVALLFAVFMGLFLLVAGALVLYVFGSLILALVLAVLDA
jgi:hypothetical protein